MCLSSTVPRVLRAKAREFPRGMPDKAIHSRLFRQAERGNGADPVGSRFQHNPDRVAELLPGSEFVTTVARSGLVYEFDRVPLQTARPSPFRKLQNEKAVELREVDRLRSVDAIERAPPHDGHKALSRETARQYELQPPPPFALPRGEKLPVIPSHLHAQYDRKISAEMTARRQRGLPYRDVTSQTFTIPKADGSARYCTNFKTTINRHQPRRHFKLEGVQHLRDMISPGDYGVSLDLRDFYLQLGLHPLHRRYCRFFDPLGRRWQWKVLAFGVSHAVRLVTKLLRPLIQQLRAMGIKVFSYVDDIVIMHQDREVVAQHMSLLLHLLQEHLHLEVKLTKCSFIPSQVFTVLGVIWDTRSFTAQLPKNRILALQRMARRLANAGTVLTRDLSRFVGTAEAARIAIPSAKRRMIGIQHQLARAVRTGGYSGKVSLSQESICALAWWGSNDLWNHNSSPITPPKRSILVTFGADASFKGWGAWLRYGDLHFQTRGFFTFREGEEMINLLELRAQHLGLQALLPLAVPRNWWHRVEVRALCGNMTAVKYGRVAVGPSLQMSRMGIVVFDFRQRTKLRVHYEHRAGLSEAIQEADYLSRLGWTHIDWVLPWRLWHVACRHFQVQPTVDLFASRSNAKTDRYYAYEAEHMAEGQDCFNAQWSDMEVPYAFPPPILLGRVLAKFRTDGVDTAMIITPAWTSANWYPGLLQMAVEPPLVLPARQNTVLNPVGVPAYHCKWHLLVWIISSRPRKQRAWTGSRRPRSSIASTRTAILRCMMPRFTSSWYGSAPPRILQESIIQQFLQR